MRQPLWIINSALLFLFIFTLGFIYFTQERIPYREDIEPTAYVKPTKEVISKVNIKKIWQNDLFDTYQRPAPPPSEVTPAVPLPPPPQPEPVQVPEVPKPEFLEPLDITLKGITVFVNDDTRNRAIIADNKTQREGLYKVGDMIEDAQLIRIFNNKIILIRSNGQQEVLYLRERDAKLDPAYAIIGGWDEVVQKITDDSYLISPTTFTQRITNLAQFIDMLDLTTVYKNGKSIGVRVGQVASDSLGALLGLQQNDVILTINDVSAADNNSRFKIYKLISDMGEDDVITVTFKRNNQELTYKYTLRDFKRPEGVAPEPTTPEEGEQPAAPPPKKTVTLSAEKLKEEQIKTLKQRHRMAPTIKDIRTRERRNMMQRGRNSKKLDEVAE